MCSKTSTGKSTPDFSAQIEKLKQALKNADAVLIGAGAGLSTSAGFTYSGARFETYFSDFAAKYGFSDMYTGGFYPFPTREEFWAYWRRYIFINRYQDAPKPVYNDLLKLVQKKAYFVITTNVDHCFQKAGFDKQRLFYTQGDYGLFQCSEPCRQETWNNETIIREMVRRQKAMRIPAELLPTCPHCGKAATLSLLSDDKFVEDKGWHAAADRYETFLHAQKNQKVVFLELSVCYNTPGIIKYPFWQMTYANSNALYACINQDEALAPKEIASQSICISGDIGQTLHLLI